MDHLIHEEIHLITKRRLGEAPAILNEGIAVYYECIVRNDIPGLSKLASDWLKCSDKKSFLRELCSNEGFWDQRNAGIPVYSAGGFLVKYIVETFGPEKLSQIFRRTYYDDPNLADVVEEELEIQMEELEELLTNLARGSNSFG